MEITIIGAGPIGCYAGYLLSKQGYQVTIYEEHKEIGLPVQCTGILTSDIYQFQDIRKIIKKSIINKVHNAEIISKNEHKISFKLKKENYIIDREKFDKGIADLAKTEGVQIHTGCKCISITESHIIIKEKNKKELKTIRKNILIGADGPNSIIRKHISKKKIKYWSGVQVTARYMNDNYVEFYPFKDGFSWIVPLNQKTARIGILARKNTGKKMQSFLIRKNIQKKDIKNWQGGLVPYYSKNLKTQKDNTYILGDAATQVKATTGGGIIPGLLAAQSLAESLKNTKIRKHNQYEKRWKKKIGLNLLMHLLIRNILDTFSEKDYERLFRYCSKRKVKEIIETYDREDALKLISTLLIKEPRFILFSKNFLKSLPS
jgi:digeranylgeranylglycerophospholipid reductase